MTEGEERAAAGVPALLRSVRRIATGVGRPIPQLAADAAADLVPGTVIVTVLQDQRLTLAATAGPRPMAHGIPWGDPGTLTSVAVRTQHGQLASDSRTDRRLDRELTRQLGALSAIAAPLLAGGRCLGALSAFASRPGAYEQADLDTLCTLADVTATRLVAAEVAVPASPRPRGLAPDELPPHGVAVWEWDVRGNEVSWSPEMFGLLGLPPDADMPSADVLNDLLGSARPVPLAARDLGAGVPDGFTGARHLRLTGFDGRDRDVAVWTRPERSPSGELLRVHGIGFDLTAANAQASELARAARIDPVTGLLNRRALEAALSELVSRLPAEGAGGVGLMMIDLDRFKLVNDTFGHHVGDSLLRQVGDRLEHGFEGWAPEPAAGSRIVAARMGGDEFVILAEGVSQCQLFELADRTQQLLAPDYELVSVVARARCPASIGMTWSNEADRGGDQLLREAEVAMYRAKELGRERWVLFNASLRTRLRQRLRAEETLRSALNTGRVVPAYQPIVQLSDETVVSYESLARVHTEDDGLLEPASFIDVAEETGLVREVDAAVLRQSLTELPELLRRTPAMSTVSVNVSAISLTDPTFALSVRETLDRAGVDPERLAFELTERVMVADGSDALASLEHLRGIGVHIGIDDFGTGYSSLAYLPKLPVQFVKVDQSFVARIETDERTASVVRAIIALAHAHGLSVTAEGVECRGQARLLAQMQCDAGQGLLWGGPRTLEQLRSLDPQPAGVPEG